MQKKNWIKHNYWKDPDNVKQIQLWKQCKFVQTRELLKICKFCIDPHLVGVVYIGFLMWHHKGKFWYKGEKWSLICMYIHSSLTYICLFNGSHTTIVQTKINPLSFLHFYPLHTYIILFNPWDGQYLTQISLDANKKSWCREATRKRIKFAWDHRRFEPERMVHGLPTFKNHGFVNVSFL